MVIIDVEKIQDPIARENFQNIQQFLNDDTLTRGKFTFYEIIFTKAETHKRIPHRLGFVPKDILQTSLTGAGAITWNYALFTTDFLDVTTTAACKVRAFIGRYNDSGA